MKNLFLDEFFFILFSDIFIYCAVQNWYKIKQSMAHFVFSVLNKTHLFISFLIRLFAKVL